MVKGKAADAAPEGKVLKKALSGYMFFATKSRDKVKAEHNIEKNTDLLKKMGEVWSGMTDKEKAPYMKLADADKERFEKEKASGMVAAPRKSKKDADGKKKRKKTKDPNAPKRAPSAYFIWLNENRAKIIADHNLPSGVAEVGRKAGALWTAMSDKDKAPYQKQAEEKKEQYHKAMAEYKAGQGEDAEEEEDDDE